MRARLRSLAANTSYGRLASSVQAFAASPNAATTWQFGNALVGVVGKDKIINAFIRYGAKLSLQAGALDESTAKEMVALMRERAPRLTGVMHDGIIAYSYGEAWAVEATAQKYETSADYARMVEFGTAPGVRGRYVASDDYFAGPFAGRRGSFNEETGRRRRVADARRRAARTHPGTPAQPFFVPTVQEVLARRGVEMAALSDSIAAEEDLA